uniref:Retrovirus-related Pol polyprotein from transposon TNT 1-94 n=1 Tax=Cajanus cajan TaxID=3821 RepID=A0A151S232_CAJCA|nr:Retrovirus-related Pol polyprotein from transposon TNT 1-94 [Cajanus cajan]
MGSYFLIMIDDFSRRVMAQLIRRMTRTILVKSAFLHGEFAEDVFVEQPHGYVQKGKEEKVYKLKKTLYGPKQALRAWYNRIEAYFLKESFKKCEYEHTLFVKQNKRGNMLIVSLYVDDLLFTGNDELVFIEFKNSMMLDFDMTDLGKMKYPIVSLSTIEVEFIAAASCSCQVIWLKRLLMTLDQTKEESITIKCDNSSAIKLSRNLVMHGRSKHIDVLFHFLQGLVQEGVIELIHYNNTSEHIFDVMTKPLKLDVFLKLRAMLGVCTENNVN